MRYLLIAFAILTSVTCKKADEPLLLPDYRDTFVGTYVGEHKYQSWEPGEPATTVLAQGSVDVTKDLDRPTMVNLSGLFFASVYVDTDGHISFSDYPANLSGDFIGDSIDVKKVNYNSAGGMWGTSFQFRGSRWRFISSLCELVLLGSQDCSPDLQSAIGLKNRYVAIYDSIRISYQLQVGDSSGNAKYKRWMIDFADLKFCIDSTTISSILFHGNPSSRSGMRISNKPVEEADVCDDRTPFRDWYKEIWKAAR